MDLTELLGYNAYKCLSEQAVSEGLLKFPPAPIMSSHLQLEKKNYTLKGEKWINITDLAPSHECGQLINVSMGISCAKPNTVGEKKEWLDSWFP